MSPRHVRCAVPGCTGTRELVTNGLGVVIEGACPYCERRAAWAAKHAVRPATVPCAICQAPIPRPVGRGKPKKHCPVCAPLFKKADRARRYVNERSAAA